MKKETAYLFRFLGLSALFLSFCFHLSAQGPHQKAHINASKKAISKLNYMVGNWSGWAEVQTRQGPIKIFQTERVEYKLDSTIILVQGTGFASDAREQIEFQALGVISFDPVQQSYRLKTYKDGQQLDVGLEVFEEDGFQWKNETPYGTMRNASSFVEGKWIDKSYFQRPETPEMPTVDMTLTRE